MYVFPLGGRKGKLKDLEDALKFILFRKYFLEILEYLTTNF